MTIDDIKIGSRWERWEAHGIGKIGEIITVEKKIDKTIHFSEQRTLHLSTFLRRFRPLAKENVSTKAIEEKAEKQPKAFYKESGEPWTREELQKLSTYLGINPINPSEYKLDRKYVYNGDGDGYFSWGLQHPHYIQGTYDRISYESIFEPTGEIPTRVNRIYIRIDEQDSPEMEEFMEEWSDYYYKNSKSAKPVYVYLKNGDFYDQSKGVAPNNWTGKGYISFIKCDNILTYKSNQKEKTMAKTIKNIPKFRTQEYIDFWQQEWKNGKKIQHAFLKNKDREDTWYDISIDGFLDYLPGEIIYRYKDKSLNISENIAIAGDLYDGSCCIASDICPEWIPDQHLASAIAATTNQTKENIMNPTSAEIKIEVNGKAIDLCPETKATKVKTDLEARKKYTIVVFNVDGSYSETLYLNAKNEDKAIAKMTKILQNPANIGKTATLHREIEVLTTSIPVVKADV